MNTVWHIATYEWRMQYRSLAFWLVALVLCAFLIGELLPRFHQNAVYATSASASAGWVFPKLLLLSVTLVLVALAMWLLQRVGRSWQAQPNEF
ncbi:MAG: hypothetical protein MI924_10575 [Chloroflexales bacterium]|nr:hypothetical protein [Chloroflexales bacterium]